MPDNPKTTIFPPPSPDDDFKEWLLNQPFEVKKPCQECGWWNRPDRSCCEACGQEDWRGQA